MGLVHFEGRSFNGWHHLVTLASLAQVFCTLRRLATAPQSRGVGLSLYAIVLELQLLLVTWAGACPTCHRDIPKQRRTLPSTTRT